MLDVQVAFLANQAMNYLVSGKTPARNGNKHPNIQPQDVFKCRDGYLVLAVGNDGQFRKFCEVISRAELADDERFATNAQRVRKLDAATVPCGPINTIPMVFEDAQVKHREMLRHLPHPISGTVPQVVSPIRLRNAPLSFDRAPPTLGQHTEEVLRELGITTP
jgi:crotonobetainyl-CoA:carnitine CoA-transferase CaiB-like acyl-CoA transferase